MCDFLIFFMWTVSQRNDPRLICVLPKSMATNCSAVGKRTPVLAKFVSLDEIY